MIRFKTDKRDRMAVLLSTPRQEAERRADATYPFGPYLFPYGYFFESTLNYAQRRPMYAQKFIIFCQFPK